MKAGDDDYICSGNIKYLLKFFLQKSNDKNCESVLAVFAFVNERNW